jgi:alkylation response protein AidB-like acyl-CoA dehydrogenase
MLQDDLRFLKADLLERTLHVATEFAATASQRDRAGGTAKTERDLLRASGLLNASIPTFLGGLGASWPELFDMVRLISRVDSSMGHLFGFQHLLLATARLFGTVDQWQPLFRATVEGRWFWGNALNPLELTTSIAPAGTDFEVTGRKSFSSGSVDADQLVVSALDSATNKLVIAVIPASRKGVTVLGDWDNMGQRQTDSGTVEFHRVAVAAHEILQSPGPLGNTFASLRPLIAQLTLTNIYVGIAEGALHEVRKHTLTSRRAWPNSSSLTAREDPLVLRRYGELSVAIASASALADRAAQTFATSFDAGDSLNPEQRGIAAIQIATAKVAATHTALKVTSDIFDLASARSTTAKLNLDRFWRNARTHTLHDPVDYKLTELGNHTLNQQLPTPSFYS